ncbi:hypothetical protein F383_18172 [Gossypium arboreum]|uniref:Uncharacterized protein n=1 Tax=Gossypium arboreum TaxID=29729 RepID=A0A0B0MAB9_GOSAR|nr:hypothetical protein F383_18172 [Gossypium arboreum]
MPLKVHDHTLKDLVPLTWMYGGARRQSCVRIPRGKLTL